MRTLIVYGKNGEKTEYKSEKRAFVILEKKTDKQRASERMRKALQQVENKGELHKLNHSVNTLKRLWNL